MKITDTHKKILRHIKKNPQATLKELGEASGICSTSTVDYHRKALLAAGLLRRVYAWEVIDSDQTRT
jgi:DNA-binding Lrp family transcriptional regulator